MAYTVLARKYRSQTFDDVVGQEPISQTLKNAIKTGRVAHAFLFSGTRGIGKTTMARVLAKALNCLSFDEPTTEPCCKCESCTAVSVGEDIDVIEIDGASNNGVDEVRKLRDNAIYRPARARFKIYIIDEVHMLTTNAFNALLKILEEPPSHVKFIFATTEPNKVIPTIQSRCQRFDFNNISPSAIAGHLANVLEKEGIKYEKDLALPLAKMANGSMRDGLSLLDRLISIGIEPLTCKLLEEFLGFGNSEKIYDLVGKIGDSDAAGVLMAVEDLINTGMGEVQIADSLTDCMRDLMVARSAGLDSELLILTSQQRKQTGELAKKFDEAGLIYNITTLEKLRWTLKNSETSRALLEASLLRFALSEHFLNVDTLLCQLPSGSKPPLKKNAVINSNTSGVSAAAPVNTAEEKPKLSALSNLESIQSNWQSILSELDKGTATLLSSAEPTGFQGGILTLTFSGGSAEISKKMCESNGRIESIQAILKEKCGTSIRLKLQIADDRQQPKSTEPPKSAQQRKNDITNDPAVRTVIAGLNASITDIQEDK